MSNGLIRAEVNVQQPVRRGRRNIQLKSIPGGITVDSASIGGRQRRRAIRPGVGHPAAIITQIRRRPVWDVVADQVDGISADGFLIKNG